MGADLDGFNDGALPGVPLLSSLRWSGFPVEVATLFGPGLIALMVIFFLFIVFSLVVTRYESRGSGGLVG